ncbi:hypothetical protein C9374_007970 [Naegleria lovaniensis]|uniref:Uncharacterized protein n=1 Tax=Naegleria lovaniensis TaxID=51637 RepID=A0AA88KG22_NAELO|nr:uncharacterized protein C9374_007970 [Naegleria lovaniensis]KAG2378822.1 hypothetical protein C9374_007970 [Naegleria lovaniensis]
MVSTRSYNNEEEEGSESCFDKTRLKLEKLSLKEKKSSSTSHDASNVCVMASTFTWTNIPFTLPSTNEFHILVFDFKYIQILGVGKALIPVDEYGRLMFLPDKSFHNTSGIQSKILSLEKSDTILDCQTCDIGGSTEISNILSMSLFYEQVVQTEVRYKTLDFRTHNFEPHEYYASMDFVMVISRDRNKLMVVEVGDKMCTFTYKHAIVRVATSPIAERFVVELSDGSILINGILKNNFLSGIPMKFISCCNPAISFFSKKGQYYGFGNGTSNLFGIAENEHNPSKHSLPVGTTDIYQVNFQLPGSVKNMKSGFYTNIFLLDDGSVFGCGYNCNGQATGSVQPHGNPGLTKFSLPWKTNENKEIVDMGCTSIGTYFTTMDARKTKHTYFVGDVVKSFDPAKLYSTSPSVYLLDWEALENELRGFDFVSHLALPNEIVPGGWFYCIAFNRNQHRGFVYEKYLKKRLQTLVHWEEHEELHGKNIFSDCIFKFEK